MSKGEIVLLWELTGEKAEYCQQVAREGVVHEAIANVWASTGLLTHLLCDTFAEMTKQGVSDEWVTGMIAGMVYKRDGIAQMIHFLDDIEDAKSWNQIDTPLKAAS